MNKLILLFLSLITLQACQNEDEPLPAYRQDLAELRTDPNGKAVSLTFDDGKTWNISNNIKGLVPDTLLRIHALYTLGENSVWLTDMVGVLTPQIRQYDASVIHTDPVNLIAIWQGMNYINLRLAVKGTSKGKHLFGFHACECIENKDGSRKLKAILIHDQNQDPLYYTHEALLSLPLRPLRNQLQAERDSLQLVIKTFKHEEVRNFAL